MLDPLWITYGWDDNDEGDFDYLVQELASAGVPATYDKIALVPGKRLWEQIGTRIMEDPLSGWSYLVTPAGLASAGCREELSYALQRVLETKGEEFPLIGLVHQVSFDDVPLALRVRLCVDLNAPNWKEQVRAGVEGRAPQREDQERSPFIVKVHRAYQSDPDATAIEFRPRFGELFYWRIGFPVDGPKPTRWGSGPSDGGGMSGMASDVVSGVRGIQIGGIDMEFVGAGDRLSASRSAYVVFVGQPPRKIFFGTVQEPMGFDMRGALFDIG